MLSSRRWFKGAWTRASRPVAPLTSTPISAPISRIKDLTDVVFSSRHHLGYRLWAIGWGKRGRWGMWGGVEEERDEKPPQRRPPSRNIISSLNVTRPAVRSIDRDVGPPAVSLRRTAVMRNSNSNIEMSGPVTFGSSYQPPSREGRREGRKPCHAVHSLS